jgi:hypothetical protein
MAGRLSFALGTILALATFAAVHSARSSQGAIYSLDFAGYPGGPVLKWLGTKGFTPKQDASNGRKVVYSVSGEELRLETKTQAFGLLLNESDVRGYSKMHIEWGVEAFPPGASYEKGVRSESVMIYVFFGKDRISSGSLLIPDSPYFIGLFLCESGKTGEAFQGRYFQAGGRYICVDRPTPGSLVQSDYPIAEAFTRVFGKAQAPDISGFGISIDTASAKGNGAAKSFLRKVEFLP